MQKKKVCTICYKKFTRKWNLDRHLYDVHDVHDDLRKDRIKQEIVVQDHLSNMAESKGKILNKDNDNNMNQTQYNRSYYNNNNFPNTLYYNYHYYNYAYPYPNLYFHYREEERKLTIYDKIKIQKILKNLENYLEKFCPRPFIFQILSWLRYQCLSQKSDQPLKKFLVRNNLGFLWPF